MHRTRERHRLGDAEQVAAALRTWPLVLARHFRMHAATPDQCQPHRDERHPADGTRARLVLDDFGMHRTAVGDRRNDGSSAWTSRALTWCGGTPPLRR